MANELLDRLRLTRLQEPSDRTRRVVDTMTCCEVEDHIRDAVEACQKLLETSDEWRVEIHRKLMSNCILLAENAALLVGIEQGIRIGQQAGERTILEARAYADHFLRSNAPFLSDVEPADEDP